MEAGRRARDLAMSRCAHAHAPCLRQLQQASYSYCGTYVVVSFLADSKQFKYIGVLSVVAVRAAPPRRNLSICNVQHECAAGSRVDGHPRRAHAAAGRVQHRGARRAAERGGGCTAGRGRRARREGRDAGHQPLPQEGRLHRHADVRLVEPSISSLRLACGRGSGIVGWSRGSTRQSTSLIAGQRHMAHMPHRH